MYLEYIAEYTVISFRNTLMWGSVALVYLIVIASGGNPKIRKSENPPVNLKRHPAELPGETAEKYLGKLQLSTPLCTKHYFLLQLWWN